MLWAYWSSVLCIYVVPVLLCMSHCACLHFVVFRVRPPTYPCRFCWQLLVAKVSPLATLELCTFVLVLNVLSSTFLDGSRRYKHLTTPERREAFSSLLSGDFYRLNISSAALHLLLEFGNDNDYNRKFKHWEAIYMGDNYEKERIYFEKLKEILERVEPRYNV